MLFTSPRDALCKQVAPHMRCANLSTINEEAELSERKHSRSHDRDTNDALTEELSMYGTRSGA